MRKLVLASMLGMGIMGMAAQALAYEDLAYEDNERYDAYTDTFGTDAKVPQGVEKFTRGVTNMAFGLPEEIIEHTLGASSEYGTDSGGAFVASSLGGAIIGTFWGIARVASGVIDFFTFPVPFNENRPLMVEPDHAL